MLKSYHNKGVIPQEDTALELKQVQQIMNKYPKAQFVRVAWDSNISGKALSAKAIKEGHTARKIVEVTARFGIDYMHTRTMREKAELLAAQGQELTRGACWYEHTDTDGVVRHKKTGDLYMQVFTVRDHQNAHSTYIVDDKAMTKAEAQETGLFKPSYFAPSNIVEVFTVKLADITAIG